MLVSVMFNCPIIVLLHEKSWILITAFCLQSPVAAKQHATYMESGFTLKSSHGKKLNHTNMSLILHGE